MTTPDPTRPEIDQGPPGESGYAPGELNLDYEVRPGGMLHLGIEVKIEDVADLLDVAQGSGRRPLRGEDIRALFERLRIVAGRLAAPPKGDAGQHPGPIIDEDDVSPDSPEFQRDMEYVLDKNTELYKRLAR